MANLWQSRVFFLLGMGGDLICVRHNLSLYQCLAFIDCNMRFSYVLGLLSLMAIFFSHRVEEEDGKENLELVSQFPLLSVC